MNTKAKYRIEMYSQLISYNLWYKSEQLVHYMEDFNINLIICNRKLLYSNITVI